MIGIRLIAGTSPLNHVVMAVRMHNTILNRIVVLPERILSTKFNAFHASAFTRQENGLLLCYCLI